MRLFLLLLTAAALAVGGGIGSAWLAFERGFPLVSLSAGPWSGWPRSGAPDADPYSRTMVARTHQIPFAVGEGILLVARADSDGAPLSGRCDYLVSGANPPARLWTLGVVDGEGRPPVLAGRTSLQSREILRAPDGRFEIRVAAAARPGNWLAAPRESAFGLALRAYDTALGADVRADKSALPRIEKKECR